MGGCLGRRIFWANSDICRSNGCFVFMRPDRMSVAVTSIRVSPVLPIQTVGFGKGFSFGFWRGVEKLIFYGRFYQTLLLW